MKQNIYISLQKKFGGKWIASSQDGKKVFAAGKEVDDVFKELSKKKIQPQKTVIGFIERYGQISAYFSVSVQKN